MKLSEILHKAADKHLHPTNSKAWASDNRLCRDGFSCIAVEWAADDRDALRRIFVGMRRLGLDTDSTMPFKDIPAGHKRQAARYAWLKFCALLAEEQGV